VSWSQYNRAVDRVTDICTRWKAAEDLLGPAIESLPQLLIIPVLLFILGLVDSLFSIALQLSARPVSIIVTSSISVALVATVAILLGFTVVDGSLHPTTSPFQSRLAYGLSVLLVQHIQPFFLRLRDILWSRTPTTPPPQFIPGTALSLDATNIFHEILQATRDDDILDEASAALFHVIAQRTAYQPVSHRFFRRLPIDLLPQEGATLLHLLSPEASIRSHRTAAQVIVDMAASGRARKFLSILQSPCSPAKLSSGPLRYSQNDLGRLLPSLAQAAKRAATGTPLSSLWDSEFVRAMAIVANLGANITRYPPAIVVLGTEHWSWKYVAPNEQEKIFGCLFEIIDTKIADALAAADADDPDATEASTIDSVLSTPSAEGALLHPRNVLASLLYIPHDTPQLMGRLVSWLLRTNAPGPLLAAADEHIHTIQRSDWLHLLGHRQFSMVPRLVSALAASFLDLESFNEHAMLAHLCAGCLLHTPDIRSRLPSGFVFFARPVLTALIAALARVDWTGVGSASLLKDVLQIRDVVEDDLLWKDGKGEVVQEFDRVLSSGRSRLHDPQSGSLISA
jgi:hypothetical protein